MVCLRVSCGVLAGVVGYACVATSVCCMTGTDVRRYVWCVVMWCACGARG